MVVARAAAIQTYEEERERARALVTQHRYQEALQLARALNHRMPDDLAVYGILVDADIAVGDLKDAERQAQWMLDLGMRQPNVPGLVRVARLRMLFGDPEGAMQMLREVLTRVPETDAEHRATLLGFAGWLELLEARSDEAGRSTAAALRLAPRNACAAAVAEKIGAAASVRAGDCPCDL